MIPALLISTLSDGYSCCAALAKRATALPSWTSSTAALIPGFAPVTSSSRFLRRPVTMTWLPSLWNASASARPMPLVPPVIRMVLPLMSTVQGSSFHQNSRPFQGVPACWRDTESALLSHGHGLVHRNIALRYNEEGGRNMTGSIWHIPDATSTPTKGDLVFHSLATLLEFPLVTSDGERRPIRSFLFDDRSWLIRYLIVDAGRWYAPRRVVIPASEVEVPDWKNKIVPARMTRDQLLSSPGLDSIRPVSRQQQLAWNREFGWPDRDPYWCGPAAAGRHFRIQGKDDPHLRRT